MQNCAIHLVLILVSGLTSWAAVTNVNSVTLSQEVMSPERFKQIVQLPADSTPLISQLAQVPFWTNSTVSNVMTYASGKVFTETMSQRTRTIEGKYVVCTVHSKFYNQPMNSILTYDAKASALKIYSLFGDGHGGNMLTEAVATFDFSKRTYTCTSAYGDGFKETTTGFYTDTEDTAKSVVRKNGALFMTRQVVTRPVTTLK